MENKDYIYDKLTEEYNYLDGIMGAIYDDKLELTKENLLLTLGELAYKMLEVQKKLVGEDELINFRIEDKEMALSSALAITTKNHIK